MSLRPLPILLTVAAMIAFAANSVLGRFALGSHSIDPSSYTGVRLLSGAIVLYCIHVLRSRSIKTPSINPLSALALFCYAYFFSLSYVNIATGTGALLLFGAVQVTMIFWGLIKGERPGWVNSAGIALALAGLVYLLLPGISAPPLTAALLMIAAGIAWGVYSLRGRKNRDPLAATAANFIATLPLALIISFWPAHTTFLSTEGIVLAIASGALSSGVGYSIWYAALPYLRATQAATVQLTVPVIATLGGVIFVEEPLTLQLIAASTAVLGGVYISIHASTWRRG